MAAPEPSPAPTLDDSFPGFYPATPAAVPDAEQPQLAAHSASSAPSPSAHAQDPDLKPALDPLTESHDRLEGAGRALIGATAGFLVGGPVGAAIGGGLAGLSAVEGQGIKERLAGSRPGTADTAKGPGAGEAPADETHRPEFGQRAVDQEQLELAHSPAQKLVHSDSAEGAHITGAGALGGALLAGAAGAKVGDNEVQIPTTVDNQAQREGLVEPEPTLPAPDFGTPAIEKEQAALATSPAQQLLRTDSSVSSSSALRDEAALLAGAAGAKLAVSREVEEPTHAPVDVAAQKALDAGAGPRSPIQAGGEEPHALPLEREISSPVQPFQQSGTATVDPTRPALPTPHGSLSSFSADVLAAAQGVETPSEAPGPAVGGFGVREPGELFITDRDIEQNNTTPKLGDSAPLASASQPSEDLVHNPSPLSPGAVSAAAAGGSVLGSDLGAKAAPEDFEPYKPPQLSPNPADAVVVERTPTASPALAGGSVLPASAVAAATSTSAVTPGSEQIPMERALDEGPKREAEGEEKKLTKEEKGKGREVPLAAAALAGTAGVGAGVGMKELLDGDKPDNKHLDTATSAAPLPTDSTLDSRDDPFLNKPDPLSEQRAFPTTPHMRPTDAAASGPTVGGGEAGRGARVLDPHELVAGAAPTSPEQAGFTNVTEMTPAMRDFAHLSQPAPVAEQQALREAPAASGAAVPAEAQEVDPEASRGKVVPVAAVGLAGIGAGAAGAEVLARDHAPTPSPPQQLTPPSTAGPQRTPVSRFQEDPSLAVPAGAQTPSSTRAVMGSPPSSTRDPSATTTPLSGSPTSTPTQSLFEAGILEKSPHMKIQTHRVDGHKRLHRKSLSGVVAPAGMSPASRRSGEFERPVQPAPLSVPPPQAPVRTGSPSILQQQQQRQQPVSTAGVSGPTGPVGERPPLDSNRSDRRDRMLNDMVGVADPTVAGYHPPQQPHSVSFQEPAVAAPSMASTTLGRNQPHAGAPPMGAPFAVRSPGSINDIPAPVGAPAEAHHLPAGAAPSAHAPEPTQAPAQAHASPSGATVGRKLSKAKHHGGPAVVGEPRHSSDGGNGGNGFFSKMFGRSGSKHSRTSSSATGEASPRASTDSSRA
ncbi:hypothetical protein Rhopal_000528-T1 [Rhodotorula paludigena]|uniref:Proteophosphoglycan ppg4 n=1 Tax=Rhodotorula paludigena TaxID=86838 RepID=A0AAV5GDY9_9BASI|nr:hypothetical protein Rhopal_000528-T1 [Rhodotorula paludigena]